MPALFLEREVKMANSELERLREALRKPATPEAMKAAAEALRKYEVERKLRGKSSKPIICSLGYKKAYPNAIPLEKASEVIATNKTFYELMGKVLNGVKG